MTITSEMRLRAFFLIVTLIVTIAFLIFKINEASIIPELTSFFPSSSENTPGYYADMISFVVAEGIWLTVLLLATVLVTNWRKFDTTVGLIDAMLVNNRKAVLIVVLVSFTIVTALIATVSLEQFPNSADEYVYLFQAQQLSEGKLWDQVHPEPEFFEFHHTAHKDGKLVGRFPPGWPFVLSIAYVLHIPPFLVNTIIGLLSLLVFYKLIRLMYDERIALWSVIFLACSSFYVFNAATYFSHMVCLLEGLLFVYFAYRYFITQQIYNALIAGVFIGLLIMTRQLTALIFHLPVMAFAIYHYRAKAIVPLIYLGLGALPGVAVFLWYNYAITGDPFVPVTMWTNADEALGFVKGHTPMQGLKFTFKRFMMFIYYASPALLIFYMWFLFIRLKNYRTLLSHPEDYIFLLLVTGYFFYYHSGGNQYGPRFYLEGLPFVVAFVIVRVMRGQERWMKAFLFCSLIYCVVKIPFIAAREHRVVEERKDVYAQVKNKDIHNAVILISSGTGVIRPMPVEDLTRNDRDFKNDVLYARDLGEKNKDLIRFYNNRDFYIYKRQIDHQQGELIKINSASSQSAQIMSQTILH